MGRAKIIFSAVLIAILCLGAVDASAQYTTIRRGGNNNTEQQQQQQQQQRRQTTPTKEQQYQKDLKAGEALFDKEQYADAKKHFVKMLPKYPKHKQEINDWIASCEMMLDDVNYGVQTTQTSSSTTSAFADKTITVNGVSFKMIAVKGGTFTMGSRRPSGLRKTRIWFNSLAHRTTWLRSDFRVQRHQHLPTRRSPSTACRSR